MKLCPEIKRLSVRYFDDVFIDDRLTVTMRVGSITAFGIELPIMDDLAHGETIDRIEGSLI